jgi:hypothetical protein
MGLLDWSAATSVFLPGELSGLVRGIVMSLSAARLLASPGETEEVKIMNATPSRGALLAALCAALAGLADPRGSGRHRCKGRRRGRGFGVPAPARS